MSWVLNAARHAYPIALAKPSGYDCPEFEPLFLLVSIRRTTGVGLPADFDPGSKSKRLGTTLVTALSKQLNAEHDTAVFRERHATLRCASHG